MALSDSNKEEIGVTVTGFFILQISTVWRRDLKEEIHVNDWMEVCKKVKTRIVNSQLKLYNTSG